MSTMREKSTVLKAPVRYQKGNAVVEFAFILPLLVFLVFGTITFSLALYDKTILTMATRDGARAGAIYVSGSTTDKEHRADSTATVACSNLISLGSGTPVIHANVSGGSNAVITVTADYTYTGLPILFISSLVLPSTIDLTAETSMRVE